MRALPNSLVSEFPNVQSPVLMGLCFLLSNEALAQSANVAIGKLLLYRLTANTVMTALAVK